MFRMQRFRNGRKQFDEEFMITRERAMDVAFQAVDGGGQPDVDQMAGEAGLPEGLEKTYVAWVRALVDHYMDLLGAESDSFEGLVRSAYRSRTDYLLTLNRLNAVEREFYGALKPYLAQSTEGVADIISTIQDRSERLRRELAELIFPSKMDANYGRWRKHEDRHRRPIGRGGGCAHARDRIAYGVLRPGYLQARGSG